MNSKTGGQIFNIKTPIWITGVWCIFWIIYAIYRSVWNLGLNEVGDFLAGVFAPVAFVWLIIGVFYQRKEVSLSLQEIRQQTEALQDQAITATEALKFNLEESKQRAIRDWRSIQPILTQGMTTLGLQKGMDIQVNVMYAPMTDLVITNNFNLNKQKLSYVAENGNINLNLPEPINDNLPALWTIEYKDKNRNEAEIDVFLNEDKEFSSKLLSLSPYE